MRKPHGLTTNSACKFDSYEARKFLKDVGQISFLGTSRSYLYNDGTSFQLQAGYGGVSASATKQYKRMPGQSFKKVLLELWSSE